MTIFDVVYSIKANSIEFLRPVFLHVFCNPIQIINAEPFWMVFLKQLKQNIPGSQILLHELFAWCRVSETTSFKLEISNYES